MTNIGTSGYDKAAVTQGTLLDMSKDSRRKRGHSVLYQSLFIYKNAALKLGER